MFVITTLAGISIDSDAHAHFTSQIHLDEDSSSKRSYETEWLDVEALLDQANSNQSIHLVVDGASFDLELEAIEMRAPGWKAYLRQGEAGHMVEANVESLGTYRARLSGQDDWSTSLTMVSGFIQAIISIDDCNDRVVETNEDPAHPARRNPPRNPERFVLIDTYEENCQESSNDEEAPPPPLIGPLGEYATVPWEELNLQALAGWSRPSNTITLKVALDADSEFYNAGASAWQSRQAAVLNAAQNKIYDEQLNIKFSIVVQLIWTTGGPTSSNCGTALAATRTSWLNNGDSITRDEVAFLYQRDLSGKVVGCHWEQSSIQDPKNKAYSLVKTKGRTATEEYRTMAHEIGHGLNGDHGYARKWRSASCAWICVKGTIMATEINTSNKIDEFSVDESDNEESNAWRIRWCAENKSSCTTLKKSGS